MASQNSEDSSNQLLNNNAPFSFPVARQRQADLAPNASHAMLLAEARESKANVRERMKFRLAQLTGAEVCEPRKLPITPVSGAAIQAIGNPLDAFLLEELGRCVGN